MNKVFLSGRLARDPEIRFSQGGSTVARTSIAVNRPFAKDTVDFFNLVTFGKTAEFLNKYFHKGSKVLVEGSLRTSAYENKDGVKVNATDVVVDAVEFADSKGQAQGKHDKSQDRDARNDHDTPNNRFSADVKK